MIKYFKYFFIWSRKFQFSNENSRMSFILIKGSNIGQDMGLIFNFY